MIGLLLISESLTTERVKSHTFASAGRYINLPLPLDLLCIYT